MIITMDNILIKYTIVHYFRSAEVAKFQFRNKLVQQKGDFYGAIRPPASNGLSINDIESRRVKLIGSLFPSNCFTRNFCLKHWNNNPGDFFLEKDCMLNSSSLLKDRRWHFLKKKHNFCRILFLFFAFCQGLSKSIRI